MKSIFITPFLILLTFAATAQNPKIKFASINQVVLLSGGKGEAFAVQTINGIKKGKWFAGPGVGLDFYNERTVPLFLDVRRDLSLCKNTLFAYADAGVNFSWLTSDQKQQKQFPKTSPGIFYDLGLGWKLSGKNNRGFLMSAGYSFKQVKEKVSYWEPAPFPQSDPQNYERYNYLYRRVIIKVGFML